MKIFHKIFSPLSWTVILLSFALSWTAIVFGTNYAVDPFGTRSWITPHIYKPIVHERSEKYNYIFNQNHIENYDCVILGSSRVMSIVPSQNKSLDGCYNFGIHAANNPEKLFLLEAWLKRAPLKRVYIGNDLYTLHAALNPLDFQQKRFTKGSESNYLSFSTFQISLKVLNNLLNDDPQTYFQRDGAIIYSKDEKMIQERTFDHSYERFRDISQRGIRKNFIETPFVYEEKALEPLRRIKQLCNRHNIKVYAFITPTFYEAQVETQRHPELIRSSLRLQSDLTVIFGKLYNFDIDTVENKEPSNFYDSVHYRPLIGNLMVERMDHNGSYGILLP